MSDGARRLNDSITEWEDISAAAVAGLAKTITTAGAATLSMEDGFSAIDITIREQQTTGNRIAGAEVLVNVTARVAVSKSKDAIRLARWLMAEVRDRLEGAPILSSKLFAKVESTTNDDISGEPTSTRVAMEVFTWTCKLHHRFGGGSDYLGANTATDAEMVNGDGLTTGHALLSSSGLLVSWENRGTKVGPVALVLFYAGASGGESVTVIDAGGTVVDTIPVVDFPTGRLTSAELGFGSYTLAIDAVPGLSTMHITERPT